METLKIRVYEGRKLLYDKHGKLENKSNVIKIGSIHYEQKFLKYYHTLGNVKVVIEDIYKDKNGEKLKMDPERIAELKAMLDKAQTEKAKVAVTDSVKVENEDLKDRLEKLEALIKSQAEAKKPEQNDSKELDDKEKEAPAPKKDEPIRKSRRVTKPKNK